MPRYAKGSLEDALWGDLQMIAAHDERQQPEKSGMTGERASIPDRMRAIRSIVRMHELGWVRDDHALQIVHEISAGAG